MRQIVDAIFYVLRNGCAWRDLPKDFPPRSTIYGWFLRFRREGLFATITITWSWLTASAPCARPRPRRR